MRTAKAGVGLGMAFWALGVSWSLFAGLVDVVVEVNVVVGMWAGIPDGLVQFM